MSRESKQWWIQHRIGTKKAVQVSVNAAQISVDNPEQKAERPSAKDMESIRWRWGEEVHSEDCDGTWGASLGDPPSLHA